MKPSWPPMLAATLALLLTGCAVAPDERSYGYGSHGYDGYGGPYYEREIIIVTPAPRIERRGPPPGPGHVWIGGYWNRVGPRHDWVPGHWSPPARQPRPPAYPQWQGGRDRVEHHRDDRGREPPRLHPAPKPRLDHDMRPDRPRTPDFGEKRRPPPEARKDGHDRQPRPDFRPRNSRDKFNDRPGDRQQPSLHINRR
ncbi:YXWGXW repeat-containing protein [Thauera sp.]|uniref:YXWGXW repeat-containing protein n=1 Tax=Thauera sp. TaxID=1905334 RepID=UPI0039E468C2